jgi:P2 family phage contractile tail tube protein
MNKVPQMLINYTMFLDGTRQVGTVDVTLPNVQAMTQSIQGAGIAGTVDVPVLGHVQNMTMTVNFRIATPEISLLTPQKYHHIEFWPALQDLDSGTGELEVVEQKVIVKAMPIGDNLGTLNPGEVQGRSLEFNVSYLKEIVGGREIREIDVFNGKFVANGNDLLGVVRQAIGI